MLPLKPNRGLPLTFNRLFSKRKILPTNTIIKFVPEKEAWIVERAGKFHRILEPGISFLLPIVDRIRYAQTLKEVAVSIPAQSAITQDNVTILLDGVLYYKIEDALKASYGVEDCHFAIQQLAQTTMRSEIGQLTLDRCLAERSRLNLNIVEAINEAAENNWGIKCLRYEIRDIQPPDSVVKAMHSQVSAERQKRAQILESEGTRQAAINVAEGQKTAAILQSEAAKAEQINVAQGRAESVFLEAKASAASIRAISEAIAESENGTHGNGAINLMVAEKYIQAFSNLAKQGNTLLLPSNLSDPASIITQAMTIYKTLDKKSN